MRKQLSHAALVLMAVAGLAACTPGGGGGETPSPTSPSATVTPSPDTETTAPAPSPSAAPVTSGPGQGNAELAIMVKPSETGTPANFTLVCVDGVPAAESQHPDACRRLPGREEQCRAAQPCAPANGPGLHHAVRRPAGGHGHRRRGRPGGRSDLHPARRLRDCRLECRQGRPWLHRRGCLSCTASLRKPGCRARPPIRRASAAMRIPTSPAGPPAGSTRSRTSSSPTTPRSRASCCAGTRAPASCSPVPPRRSAPAGSTTARPTTANSPPPASRRAARPSRSTSSPFSGTGGTHCSSPGSSWPGRRRGRRSSAASGCTSGPWSTGRTNSSSGTSTCSCGSAPNGPTRWWRRTGSAARTSMPSASTPRTPCR